MDGRGGGGPPPPPPVKPWVASRSGPFNLPLNLDALRKIYLKLFPKYNGDKYIIAEECMVIFHEFTNNIYIEHDDVFMRLFFQTLEGEVRKWFIYFPDSLNPLHALETTFMRKWGEMRDLLYYLT